MWRRRHGTPASEGGVADAADSVGVLPAGAHGQRPTTQQPQHGRPGVEEPAQRGRGVRHDSSARRRGVAKARASLNAPLTMSSEPSRPVRADARPVGAQSAPGADLSPQATRDDRASPAPQPGRPSPGNRRPAAASSSPQSMADDTSTPEEALAGASAILREAFLDFGDFVEVEELRELEAAGVLEQVPRDDDGRLTSVGAISHRFGQCTPCAYWFKGICKFSVKCTYCHFVHEGQKSKRLRPPKQTRMRMRRRQLMAMEAPETPGILPAFVGGRVSPQLSATSSRCSSSEVGADAGRSLEIVSLAARASELLQGLPQEGPDRPDSAAELAPGLPQSASLSEVLRSMPPPCTLVSEPASASETHSTMGGIRLAPRPFVGPPSISEVAEDSKDTPEIVSITRFSL